MPSIIENGNEEILMEANYLMAKIHMKMGSLNID